MSRRSGSPAGENPNPLHLTAAEAARITRENMLRVILDSIPGMVGLFTPDGVQLEINRAPLIPFGLTREQVVGIPIWDAPWFARDDATSRQLWKDVFVRVRAGETLEFESRSTLPDGSVFYANNHIAPIRDASGAITHVIGFGVDNTARHRAEEELRRSEERFRLLASSPTAYTVIIQDGLVRFASKSYYDTTGYSEQELIGQSFLMPVHPDFRELVKENAARRVRGDAVPITYEIKIVSKLGAERWLSISGDRITYEGRPAILGTGFDITRLKAAEEHLRRSQAQLKALLEAVPDATFRYKVDGTFLDFKPPSPYWQLSMAPNSIIGSNVRQMQAPQQVIDLLMETSRLATSTQRLQTINYEIPTPGGARSFEARIVPSRNDELVSIVRDTTELRVAEESARRAFSLFTTAMDVTVDGVMVVGNDGIVVAANKRFQQLWQIPDEELATRDCGRMIGFVAGQLSDPESFARRIELLKATPEATSMDEISFVDGRVFECYSAPHKVEGEVVGRVWCYRDITRRKQVHESLSRTQFSVDHAGIAIYWIDAEARVTYANEEASRCLRHSREELTRLSWLDFNPDFQPGQIKAFFNRVRDEKVVKFESRHRTSDGRIFPVEITANYELHGQRGYICAFVRDITERKELEESLRSFNARLEEQVFERTLQLAEAKEAAEAADRTKTAFLTRMSHELRTPLTSIIGLSELLQEEATAQEMEHCRKDLAKIEESGKNLLEMINDILDITKLESGALPVSPQWVWVDEVLQEIVESTEPLVRVNSNALLFDVREKGEFWADPARFKQVLRALVSNAAKFTHAGTITITVSRQSGENFSWLNWEVADTGIGVPPERRETLFTPFHPAPISSGNRKGGTGLGLAIARHLAQLMGGELRYEPSAGGGSIFSVRLPNLTRPS